MIIIETSTIFILENKYVYLSSYELKANILSSLMFIFIIQNSNALNMFLEQSIVIFVNDITNFILLYISAAFS